MLEDSAGTVDDKFGKQYGDYARSAASTVAGLASTLDQKDLEELAASTRDFVQKSPAVAVGAAAVIGFVLARMLKGGLQDVPHLDLTRYDPPLPTPPHRT